MPEKRKIKITKQKAHKIAVFNILFLTLIAVGCWMIPLFGKTWHVKRWFVLLTPAIKLNLGLWGYSMDYECHKKTFDWQSRFCEWVEGDKNIGTHSYFDLQDWACHIGQSTKQILFRGCDEVIRLNIGSMCVGVAICISLWFMIMGCALSYLYYFAGMSSKRVWNFMTVFFALAPLLQMCALIMYVMLTFDLDNFVDLGILSRMPGAKIVFGSPSGTITFNHAFIGAVCCMFMSFLPAMALFFSGRDKNLESEYSELDYDANNYGTNNEAGLWNSYDDLADQSGMEAGTAGQQQYGSSQQQYDPNQQEQQYDQSQQQFDPNQQQQQYDQSQQQGGYAY